MRLLRDQDVAPRATPTPSAERSSADAPDSGLAADAGVDSPRGLDARGRLVMLLVLIFIGIVGVRWIRSTPGFAVRRVVIDGSVHSNAAALAESTGAVGISTFSVDLEGVRLSVLADPWIAEARVRRVLPHELRITVVERVPVAVRELGAERALLDAEGRVLEDGLEPGRFQLPAIVGLERVAPADRTERMARAAASLGAIRAASPHLFRVTRVIDVSSSERMTLVSDSLPPIWIVGPESADEVAGYACRVETVRRAIGDVEYVDARWSNRLFVMPTAVHG